MRYGLGVSTCTRDIKMWNRGDLPRSDLGGDLEGPLVRGGGNSLGGPLTVGERGLGDLEPVERSGVNTVTASSRASSHVLGNGA